MVGSIKRMLEEGFTAGQISVEPTGDDDRAPRDEAVWSGVINGIQASWRYLNYSERWHARGDHFAGVQHRIRAILAYNHARFLQRYSLSDARSKECEPHMAALAVALEVDLKRT